MSPAACRAEVTENVLVGHVVLICGASAVCSCIS